MNKSLTILIAAFYASGIASTSEAKDVIVKSPDGQLAVSVSDNGARATYAVTYGGQQLIRPSRLGLTTDYADFSGQLTITDSRTDRRTETYSMHQTKKGTISYEANTLDVVFENAKKQKLTVEFVVENNDVAFRYDLQRQQNDNPKCAIVKEELTSFLLPDSTRTFICPQIGPFTGWERTKPSYEEEYVPDAPILTASKFGRGYTFPCLFRVPAAVLPAKKNTADTNSSWILISETGVDGKYCGSHLSDYSPAAGYQIAFPDPNENNGYGSWQPNIPVPGSTPWRTITLGNSLKPVVETTIAYDVVEQRYEPSENYRGGRYTWSWLIWQDNSIVWDDQVEFIDLAADMGYEYCLVDGCWDTMIGRDKIEELSDYAREKRVSLMLWYNSNGLWNDAPQTPRHCMDTPMARDREMAWLKKIGVKGIKVDFFGGDKQQTMQLYEDILYDANRYGLQVIFHGCTLPRGWERMYPNYVSSEAVLASENVYFSEHHARQEPFELTMHPFCRNAVATMDWGGVILNKYMSRDNRSRHQRTTTDGFELATAFTNQAFIQCIAMQPNNLQELPQAELDFLRQIPTRWDDTQFIEGYPGKYIVLARQSEGKWYIACLNGTDAPLTLSLPLAKYFGTQAQVITDAIDKKGNVSGIDSKTLKANKKGSVNLRIAPRGGAVVY